MYNSINDEDFKVKQNIDTNYILKYLTQEEIYELVFNFKPKEYEYVCSPFRKDNNPNCYFSYSLKGELRFTDFGNSDVIYKINLNNINCFNAVQLYYKIENLYEACLFIKEKLIDNSFTKKELLIKSKKIDKLKQETIIHIEPRLFNNKDKQFWKQYDITSDNLKEDKVFAISKFNILNGKNGNYNNYTYDIAYCYTDFENNHKKIYRPTQHSKNKFITNCSADDIYGINQLIDTDKLLIITKSYKDYRVLKNQNYNVIAFQNEGMFPNKELLKSICKRFDKIAIFYDNDDTGIKASEKLKNLINGFFPNKAFSIMIPIELYQLNITDPSDYIKVYKKQKLNELLNKLLC